MTLTAPSQIPPYYGDYLHGGAIEVMVDIVLRHLEAGYMLELEVFLDQLQDSMTVEAYNQLACDLNENFIEQHRQQCQNDLQESYRQLLERQLPPQPLACVSASMH